MTPQDVLALVRKLEHQPNVAFPTEAELRAGAELAANRTEFGNLVFSTSVKSRSAKMTVYVGSTAVLQSRPSPLQQQLLKNWPRTIEKVAHYLASAPLLASRCRMGDNSEFAPRCTMYTSVYRRDSVRLPFMWAKLLYPDGGGTAPDLFLVYLPEWQEKDRQIIVFPEVGVTFVLGSDYLGEAKKGFLRMAMWYAKASGMLGVHAGAKLLSARDAAGRLRRYSMLLFGLSATGKTTHTCHNHGLAGPGEGIGITQDDVVLLRPDGSALGTERGFFLKTDIDRENQPLVYQAATGPDAVFENVYVDYQGRVSFLDDTLTGNGRGVIQRSDLGSENLSPTINLPPLADVDGMVIAFITRRNTVVPIVSRLNPEQAAAAFMLGESIETSAGDPTRVGESVRVVGTNPFIVGDEGTEGLWFYEFLQRNCAKVQCYLLNTGGVGERATRDAAGARVVTRPVDRVAIAEMAAIIGAVARGAISWQPDPAFGADIPAAVPGIDIHRFDRDRFYDPAEIAAMVTALRRERTEYLARFPRLPASVCASFAD